MLLLWGHNMAWMEEIQRQIHNNNEQMSNAFPAVIVGISKQYPPIVSVKPLCQRYTDGGENMDDTPIINIPVAMQRSGTTIFYFPIKVGDTGMCIVSDNDAEHLKIGNGSPTKVNSNRMKDQMDSFFYPGIGPTPVMALQAQSMVLPKDFSDVFIVHNVGTGQEAMVTIKADGNVELDSQFTVKIKAKDIDMTATNSISLNAQSMNINVANTQWAGQAYVTGEVTVNGIPVSTHHHLGVTPGNGVSGLPTV